MIKFKFGVALALLVLSLTLSGCGMQATVGSHTAYGAATDYVSALADRDYDRVRALRDPDEFKQIAFDNGYFDDERARLGINQANPTYASVIITDTNGKVVAQNDALSGATGYISLSVVSGPRLLITTTLHSDLWYVSGITKNQ